MRLLPANRETAWTPYAWLAYLLFFVLYPLGVHSSATVMWASFAGAGVFLPLYFWGHWLEGKRVLWIIAAITALAIGFCRFNPCASVFLVFAAAFIGQIGDSRVGFKYLAGYLVLIGAIVWLLRPPPAFWAPGLFFAALVGAVDIHFTQQRRDNRKLRAAQEEIEHLAKVAERERIGRDLHDLLGHTLSLITLKSELAARLVSSNPVRAAVEMREVEQVSREALAQVRAAVRGYRSQGLDSEIAEARNMLETAGIQVEAAMERPALSLGQETVLVLALREAVTNVVRHSQATICRLRLGNAGSLCELEIADNGRGGSAPEGSGLTGMRSRVEALGGTLMRQTEGGTTIRICLPLEPAFGAA